MDNKIKNYLDRVVMELVGSTILDYEKEKITFPYSITPPYSYFRFFYFMTTQNHFNYSFKIYCKNMFGLTDVEIRYVWEIYREIIKDKIENNEQ